MSLSAIVQKQVRVDLIEKLTLRLDQKILFHQLVFFQDLHCVRHSVVLLANEVHLAK